MSSQSSMMPFAYFRKGIIPSSKASVSIASHSLQYGTTCFGGIRGYFREGKVQNPASGGPFHPFKKCCHHIGNELSTLMGGF